MTRQDAIEQASKKLEQISQTPKLDAQLLVCHVSDIELSKLFSHPEVTLGLSQISKFDSILERRIAGEPIAYITGTKEFWSREFEVNEHVLIPRPETELLVEQVLIELHDDKTLNILELGTGSGAIAITIAKECHQCNVTATDTSDAALELAKTNANNHGVEIEFINSNWYEKISNENFDVIVSNPPYVAENDEHLDLYVKQYEPVTALISSDDGLKDIKIIIQNAPLHLNSNGFLCIEHGHDQAADVFKFFKENNFREIYTHKDLANLDRVTTGFLMK